MNNAPKRHILVCFFLLQSMFLLAQDYNAENLAGLAWEVYEPLEYTPQPRGRFAFRNRAFELSTQVGLHAANNFLSYGDFFQSPFRILRNLTNAGSFGEFLDDPSNYYVDLISINLGDFFDGFRLNFGLDVAPLSININVRDSWGFGFDIAHVSATGNLSIPGNVLRLREAEEMFGVGGAVFFEVGVPVFFHTYGFRVSIRPAAFVPLFSVRPGLTYTRDGYRIEVAYDMRIFSPFSLDGNGDIMDGIMADPLGLARNSLGYDISLGVEYPLLPWLSVGVNFVNIPLPFLSSRLDYYTRIEGRAFFDSGNIDLGPMFGEDGEVFGDDMWGFETLSPVFGTDAGQRIRRPFTMLAHADLRPFGTRIVSVLPSLGFSINSTHARIASLEGGLSARLDLANIFITTIGINYNDRRWINSLDLALNLRLLEIGIGVSMQSPEFVGSFRGRGLGVNFGIKTGW